MKKQNYKSVNHEILLAGASGNLGKELFKQLSEQEYDLIAADLNIDKLPKPKESSRVELRKIDVNLFHNGDIIFLNKKLAVPASFCYYWFE
jgi:short-subunit dehydrogenase